MRKPSRHGAKHKVYELVQHPTVLYGLKYRPSVAPKYSDDDDSILDIRKGYNISPQNEVSGCNKDALKDAILSLDIATCILEISVSRGGYERSTSKVLIDNRPKGYVYIGVDIADRSYIEDKGKDIHFIKSPSEKKDVVYAKMEELGLEKIDFIFIDGWHSVNQILSEWEYIEKLSPKGIIAMHDTNSHPGPWALYEAIDEKLFDKMKYCTAKSDWGYCRS